jgi:hypothetical protein
MKKYVSAILIDALLLQFCGCYSQKEITLDELKSDEQEIQFATKDSSKYCLKKEINSQEIGENLDIRFSDDWLINPELGIITTMSKKAIRDSNETDKYYLIVDTSNVDYGEIKEISARRLNGIKIAIAIGVTVGLFVALVKAIKDSMSGGWRFNWQ